MVLRIVNDSSPSMMDGSLVFTDSYIIPRLCLCSADQDEVYQCEVVINTSPPVIGIGSVPLDLMGECIYQVVYVWPTWPESRYLHIVLQGLQANCDSKSLTLGTDISQ